MCPAVRNVKLARGASSGGVPSPTKAAATGYAELSSPAAGAGAHHPGRRLHELACGGGGMSGVETSFTNIATHTADTPQLLLEHHLKEPRLPTIPPEYAKVARQCPVAQLHYPPY